MAKVIGETVMKTSNLVPFLEMQLQEIDPADPAIVDRLGGAPNQWTDDEPWPRCRACEEPLDFVCQLLGESLSGRVRLGKAAALQLFVCRLCDCEFYELGSHGNHITLRRGLTAMLAQRPPAPPCKVVGDRLATARSMTFTPGEDDIEALEDYDSPRFETAHDRGFTDKLYGVPVAADEPQPVVCDTCQRSASFLGQLLSADDWFIYYLHLCEGCYQPFFHARRA